MINIRLFLFAFVVIINPLSVTASSFIVDQEQPLINETAGFLGIGGNSEQKLAQTFVVGMTGDLAGLRLPIICGGGELLIQILQQSEEQPTGRLLRALIVAATDVPSSYAGFTDFFFPVPIDVTIGDRLAFSVQTVGEDSFCSYASAPAGDTYARGAGFFDSRPNPPGWSAFTGSLDSYKDLAFFTLMLDLSRPGSSGNCVIPGSTDPVTGLPYELPISNYVPACRCFADAGAREMRCGILHPDFFIVRRFAFPMVAGKPFEEHWQFTPLTKLDGPVRISISGGGLGKSVGFEFGRKSGNQKTETFSTKAMAPKEAIVIPGSALIQYDMKDAKSEYQRSFGVDTSIYLSRFEK